MHRTFHIVKTPTMNQILLWSTEFSSLSVDFLPEEHRKNKTSIQWTQSSQIYRSNQKIIFSRRQSSLI